MTKQTVAAVVAVALLGWQTAACEAGGRSWGNAVLRDLGIGWSDGYHAYEGCPTERVGRRRYPGPMGWSGSYPPYGIPAGAPVYGPQGPRPARHPTWIPFNPDNGQTMPARAAQPIFSDPSDPVGPHHPSGPLLPSAQARPTFLR
jgi:hypothetical protein